MVEQMNHNRILKLMLNLSKLLNLIIGEFIQSSQHQKIHLGLEQMYWADSIWAEQQVPRKKFSMIEQKTG